MCRRSALARSELLLLAVLAGGSSDAPHSADSATLVQTSLAGGSAADSTRAKAAWPAKFPKKAVWVHATFPRSGSSTALSMVENGVHPADRRFLFALFEPCHHEDRLSAKLRIAGCSALLDEILSCHFEEVFGLWGWDNPHSVHLGVLHFWPKQASRVCRRAGLTAFKTLGQPLTKESLQLLRTHEQLQVVDVVRDPRSIISSWRSTPGMNISSVLPSGPKGLLAICHGYATGLSVTHERLHRMAFEDLIRRPEAEVRRIYGLLGLAFSAVQSVWLKRTFSARNCTAVGPYTDCRTDSEKHVEDWRQTLPPEEQAAFAADPQCQRVAKAYGWPKA